ncbi:MAG: aldo/keto reductase, partial [Deltaproteobacteria bacterium]
FGCMRLPQKKGSPGVGKIDEKRATKQIRMAIDEGVNYIDTAMPYHMGACEPFLGKALSEGYREKVKLATKMPHWSVERREDMDNIIGSQLKRLKSNQIDYYLLHGLNGDSWEKIESKGVANFLEQSKADGRIGNAGFSFHGNYDAFIKIVDSYNWDFCQIQYNFLDEQNQAGKRGLEYAASKDIGVIIMEPLRGGLIRDNIRTANEGVPNSLSEEELHIIRSVEDKYRSLMKAGCTGCHYCMPCPNGVNIPACFEAYNYSHLYGDTKWAKFFYLARVGGLDGNPGRASQCEECGDCVEVCPQELPIPDLHKEVTSEMEGRFYDAKLWFFSKIMKIQRKKILKNGSQQI